LRRSSPLKDKCGRGPRWFLASVALAALGTAARGAQPGELLIAQDRHVVIERPTTPASSGAVRLNPTGKPVELTVPIKDGARYLGDISVTIDPNDNVRFPAKRLWDLLRNVVDPNILRAMEPAFGTATSVRAASFAASGINIHYDPQELALQLTIASQARATQALQVSPLDRPDIGTFAKPANVSGYLNVRGNLDFISDGFNKGLRHPVFYLDGATRLGPVVLESDGIWNPGGDGPRFQRNGTRFVYDSMKLLARFTAGDLLTVGRGFQSAPDIAGFSAYRSYNVLQPQRMVRPRGDRSFRLERPATVEIQVNGQIVRRLQLTPGNYDLRDFPFTQGANDINVYVLDDAGRRELFRFNVFLDQTQLASGLSEFGVYAGVLSPFSGSGPDYSSDPAVSAWYRRGISDTLTLGGNLQGDKNGQMAGVEGVFATQLGTFGGNVSLSQIDGYGMGWGTLLTFQRLIQRSSGQADSLSLSFESRSKDFGALGIRDPINPYAWEAGGGYTHAFTDYIYAGVDGRYSRGRAAQPDVHSLRGTVGWRISRALTFTTDARWERNSSGRHISGLFSLVYRLGRYSTVRSDYDTRGNRARLSYNTLRGQGVGSYNIAADVERSDFGSGFDMIANYYGNRAELGISHFGTFEGDFGSSTQERTSLRFASSIAFADSSVSVGRPIYDSFALLVPHRGLDGAALVIDPTPLGYTASSGVLGAATQPSISSYAERTVIVDAPGAKAGVDLGQGSFRLFPPYKSGYRLVVGSDYTVTAIGRLLNADGEPIALLTGSAVEMMHPERTPVELFTNRDGRFGAVGLAPGNWRIEMKDDQRSTYMLDIGRDVSGVLRVGDLRPTESRK
jgi:outer membrane usher protein